MLHDLIDAKFVTCFVARQQSTGIMTTWLKSMAISLSTMVNTCCAWQASSLNVFPFLVTTIHICRWALIMPEFSSPCKHLQ